jgi:hypothetical protein
MQHYPFGGLLGFAQRTAFSILISTLHLKNHSKTPFFNATFFDALQALSIKACRACFFSRAYIPFI